MSEEISQHQACDATDPEEKMLGKFWGIDFFLIHEPRLLPGSIELH
jgi:hypothetical protein